MSKVIRKNLGGFEDLELGSGTAVQTRGDETVPVTRINAEWVFYSTADIATLDTTRFKHVTFVNTVSNIHNKFDYDASSTATANNQDVIAPTLGSGRWLLRRENNIQVQQTATGTGGLSTSSHSGIPTGFVITTNFGDDSNIPGSGASYQYTGTTVLAKAGHWPDTDGFYYDADGKQFQLYDPAKLPTGVNAVVATTYTFVRTDMAIAGGKALVTFNNSAQQNVTIPKSSSVPFPLGNSINIVQIGTGIVHLVADTGVTIYGGTDTVGQYHCLSIAQIATDTWLVIGGNTQVTLAGVAITLSNQTLNKDSDLCGIVLSANGEMQTVDASGALTLPSEWALPRTPGIGSLFEARMTVVSGTTSVGSLTNVWVPLDAAQGWGVAETGTTKHFVGLLEIRDKATHTTADSATVDITSTHV